MLPERLFAQFLLSQHPRAVAGLGFTLRLLLFALRSAAASPTREIPFETGPPQLVS